MWAFVSCDQRLPEVILSHLELKDGQSRSVQMVDQVNSILAIVLIFSRSRSYDDTLVNDHLLLWFPVLIKEFWIDGFVFIICLCCLSLCLFMCALEVVQIWFVWFWVIGPCNILRIPCLFTPIAEVSCWAIVLNTVSNHLFMNEWHLYWQYFLYTSMLAWWLISGPELITVPRQYGVYEYSLVMKIRLYQN